ncbi:phage baseplate assembly protein V [Aureisphaera galaxeae]|uniref:phage baseplate assembly protein V n=1 Tax=Aureisphaera galaxeae TaxID=1538023 RepID=UPI002350282C|nr:phage baseplate assembly protein V [Aureisphaera galaxeae]MDC8005353.1 phage baseplate assembly protein V [Aureisphaera galaxeae]
MSVTPYTPEYNTLQLEILINGTNEGLHTVLKKAEVHYELNKIPYAKLHFISSNPDIDPDDNPLQSDVLAVTDEIEIKATTDEEAETLFKGIVYKVERNADPSAGFETKIECKDKAVNLTSQQDVVADETFAEKMDRFLGEVEVTNEADLGAFGEETVSKTQNVTPWDYIISYLDGLGYMSTVREGVFTIFDSTADPEEATYLAKNGVNVFEFEGREEESVSDVEVRYWNPETQTVETQESSTNVTNGSGREVVDMSQSNFSSETLAQMAAAIAAKNRLNTLKGRVKTFGNLQAKYGENITFEKVNAAIDETPVLIHTEHHTIENGCWDTEYKFGLESNQSFAQNISSASPSSTARTGQTNSMQGLQIGIVTQLEDDPNNEFRVRVRIPSISDSAEGVWARLASFQAGSERGAFFIPEVEDEVILGCLNNNPDAPVILGKLYSSSKPMPFPITADNYIQGIVSKEGTQVVLNDEDKSVEISTTNGNKLLISDAEKGFVLEDENGNSIKMNDQGITIESAKDIVLKASKDIKVEGVKSSLKASGQMELKGQLIKLN